MQVTHKISFQGGKDFEQHTAEFTISDSDIRAGEAVDSCNLLERMFIFNTLVLFEGLLFQFSEGYLSREDLEKRRKRIFGLLNSKLQDVVKTLLGERKDARDDKQESA